MAGNKIKKKQDEIIKVNNLVKYFPVTGGIIRHTINQVKAVDGVSFTINKGKTLGLVGESGCGKTTVGHTMLGLVPATSGSLFFKGKDLLKLQSEEEKKIRRQIQIVFQDPYSSLDPRLPVGESIVEGLKIHKVGSRKEQFERVLEVLEWVGLEDYHAMRYPHEFSGGQRQRIGIARALILEPEFIVLDEPVSALDVSIQAQILNILKELQKELGLSYLFIAHNLAVVEHISDRIAVMYLGKIVENTSKVDLFKRPLHPYTIALTSSIPIPDPGRSKKKIAISGEVPSALNPPSGCRFHPRCPLAQEICSNDEPELRELFEGHHVACHFAEKNF